MPGARSARAPWAAAARAELQVVTAMATLGRVPERGCRRSALPTPPLMGARLAQPGGASSLRRARAALTTNDLKGAADALQKAGGPAGDWARDAMRRVAADQALYRLRLWALKALEAATTEKSTTQ